jgi:hypothetical protein
MAGPMESKLRVVSRESILRGKREGEDGLTSDELHLGNLE